MYKHLSEAYIFLKETYIKKFEQILQKISPYTMVNPNKLKVIYNYIMKNKLDGDIVECGVWKGGSCMLMAYTLMNNNIYSKNIWLYDTFEGLPQPSSDKDDIKAKNYWNDINSRKIDKGSRGGTIINNEVKWNYAPLDNVRNNMNSTNYPIKYIKYVKGKVEDTLNINTNIPKKISILRLDTDWYDSTKKELDILYPLVVSGGLIQIDDYCTWKGSKTATDEWLKTHKEEVYAIDKNFNKINIEKVSNNICLTLIKK